MSLIILAAHEVRTRSGHRCTDCGGYFLPPTPMLRFVGLESLEGGFVATYTCPLCPWGTERRKPDWRRKVWGRHGAKSTTGRRRACNARNGTDAETGTRMR